jgi:putative oxidoreductase
MTTSPLTLPPAIPSSRIDAGLAFLRAVVGTIFVAHGAQKLFVFGLDGISGAFGQMGVPLPGVFGPGVALLEFFGGIALVLGLLTRLAGLGLFFTMVGAMFLVHLPNGFFAPNGIEFTLALAGATMGFALMGAGRYSLDHLLATRRSLS